MKPKTKNQRALAAVCSCGGWVMVAALGYGKESDADSYKEAAHMVSEGYDIRHGSVEEIRRLPMCEHNGRCLTGAFVESDLEAHGQERLPL